MTNQFYYQNRLDAGRNASSRLWQITGVICLVIILFSFFSIQVIQAKAPPAAANQADNRPPRPR